MVNVYRHINATTGETFYIGIASNSTRARIKSNRTNFWKSLVNKYGYEVQELTSNISGVCRGNRKTTGGFTFKYL